MTIYILDNDPHLCAEYLDDKSLDKMIKDIAQVLCNIHSELQYNTKDLYKKDIIKWSNWAQECKANYLYLVELGEYCIEEWLHRFKRHSTGFNSKTGKFENDYFKPHK